MTKIKIPAHWIEHRELNVNTWLAARGATVVEREKTRNFWTITIQQNLNAAQQDALTGLIVGRLNTVQYEII